MQDFGNLRFTLFRNNINHIITALAGQPPVNSDEYRVAGLEAEARFHFSTGISIRANYTFQDAEDSSTGRTLPDVPRYKGNILLNYRIAPKYNLNTHLFIKGDTDRTANDQRPENNGYAVVNMTLISSELFPEVKGIEGRLSIYNLFDTEYEDPSSVGIADYPQPDRTIHGQVIYRFR